MEKYIVKQGQRLVYAVHAEPSAIADVEAALPQGYALQLVAFDQKYALFFNNRVSEIVDLPFEIHESMTWLPCAADLPVGPYTLEEGILTPVPQTPPAPARALLPKLVLSRRIINAGLADAVAAALDGNAVYRLLWEGISEGVYKDDEEVRMFLLAVTGDQNAVDELLA